MKLDNKGITLVEIIISVALISIVLVFLFTLLIQVNNENADNEVRASYLVNQSTFIKQIEEDMLDYQYDPTQSSICSIDTTENTSNDSLVLPRLLTGSATIQKQGTEGNIKCLKLNFTDPNSTGYLFLYKRDNTSTTTDTSDYETVLSYYRGDFKQSVVLEDFNWKDNYSSDSTIFDAKCETSSSFTICTLPILGPDYNDYSINLSYAS